MLTKEQLENRINYVGGSDAPIIMGLSPYRNVVDLWHEKTGQIEPRDISDNPYVKAGNFLEPCIRTWFEHETGLKITHENEFYAHPEYDFIGGHIDGWIRSENAIFEAKTSTNDKIWGSNGINQIPDHYLIQIAYYMAITGAHKAYIAVLIRGVDFRFYTIERNLRLEQLIIERVLAFWSCVMNGNPPTPSTASEVISLHGFRSNQESIVASSDIETCMSDLDKINLALESLNEKKQKLHDQIKVFMGMNDTLVESTGKILATWKETKPSIRFDVQAFKKDRPEDYINYTKTCSGSRRFIVKTNEELKNDI